jgi:hypothetical protein
MEDPHFAKQDYGQTASPPLVDLRPRVTKKSFGVLPLYVGARRVGKDRCKGARLLPLHVAMVLLEGTMRKRRSLLADG